MSSYKTKVGGLIFTPVALLLFMIVQLHGPFQFIPKPDQQADILFVLTLFGMYIIACSKEKYDDERVRAVRAKALQVAFMLLVGTMLSISMTFATAKHPVSSDDGPTLSFMAAFGLGFYLVVFHYGLYFDPAWNYNDDTVIPNIKKNKKFFIIYTLAAILLFAIAILIHRA